VLAIGIAKVELDRAQLRMGARVMLVMLVCCVMTTMLVTSTSTPRSQADRPDELKDHSLSFNNGRLAMLAAAGFMAQELVDGKGILEHLGVAL
jgi:hypothetical protein